MAKAKPNGKRGNNAPNNKRKARAKRQSPATETLGEDGLTGKQRAWIYEYPKDWNGTAAARRAGFRGNANTLGVTAHDLLRNPKIAAALKKRLAELAMDADEVLARLGDHARGSMGDFMTPRGSLSLKEARKAGKLHLVHAYSKGRAGTRIELYDAQAALALLGKHHKLFTDVRIRTWRDDVIDLLREGKITPEQVKAEFGEEIAESVVIAAGLRRSEDRKAEAPGEDSGPRESGHTGEDI